MSSKKPDIWMPFYMGDFQSSTSGLSYEEKWAYVLLIWEYWRKGHKGERIKFDKKIIKNIVGISLKKLENILPFFQVKDGFLFHPRIEREILKAQEDKELQRNRTEAATAARMAKREAEKAAAQNVTTDVTSNVTYNVTTNVAKSPSPSSLPLIKNDKRSSYHRNDKNVDKSLPSPLAQSLSKKDFNVNNFLTDVDRMCVLSEAPKWDLEALVITFNTFIIEKCKETPKNPSAAFLAWVISFTKGKPPC